MLSGCTNNLTTTDLKCFDVSDNFISYNENYKNDKNEIVECPKDGVIPSSVDGVEITE